MVPQRPFPALVALALQPVVLSGQDEQVPVAPVPVVALPGDEDEDVDRRRRIGVLRNYLARIQRGREAAAR